MTTHTFEIQDDGTVEFQTAVATVYTFETAPPQGVPGVGISSRITKLEITLSKISGSLYSAVSNGVGYTFSGNEAILKNTSLEFNEDCSIIFYLNGILLFKSVEVTWVSQNSFRLQYQVDIGDEILIFS